MIDQELDVPGPSGSEFLVESWRLEQLERMGFPHELAIELAVSDNRPDLHVAARLIAGGCTPELAARILL